MKEVCIIDTSVFCNILGIPKRSQQYQQAIIEFEEGIKNGVAFLLPMTTVYETGNHIAQVPDGRRRRKLAQNFVNFIDQAFTGKRPWTITPTPDLHKIRDWLHEFPQNAMQERGFGDLAIIKIWQEQCQLNQGRRVYIWSYDHKDLSGYDRPAKV